MHTIHDLPGYGQLGVKILADGFAVCARIDPGDCWVPATSPNEPRPRTEAWAVGLGLETLGGLIVAREKRLSDDSQYASTRVIEINV